MASYRVLAEYTVNAESAEQAMNTVLDLAPDDNFFGDPLWDLQILCACKGHGIGSAPQDDRWPTNWPEHEEAE